MISVELIYCFLPTFESLKFCYFLSSSSCFTANCVYWCCTLWVIAPISAELADIIQHSDTSPALINPAPLTNLISCFRYGFERYAKIQSVSLKHFASFLKTIKCHFSRHQFIYLSTEASHFSVYFWSLLALACFTGLSRWLTINFHCAGSSIFCPLSVTHLCWSCTIGFAQVSFETPRDFFKLMVHKHSKFAF